MYSSLDCILRVELCRSGKHYLLRAENVSADQICSAPRLPIQTIFANDYWMGVGRFLICVLLCWQGWGGAALARSDADPVVRPMARQMKDILTDQSGVELTRAISADISKAPTGSDITTQSPLFAPGFRPPSRKGQIPRTRWQHMPGHAIWTRAALSALKAHGKPLVALVPGDIDTWCPAYRDADDEKRRAFWVGFMSSLAKHESTYKPWAVGGGGRWYGLLQILPSTARGYKCNVGTGEALKSGAANLSCAVRIMAHTVPRDRVIHGYRGRKGLGVTADWGPMHSAAKRRDMAGWLRRQAYCTPLGSTRPRLRPVPATSQP